MSYHTHAGGSFNSRLREEATYQLVGKQLQEMFQLTPP